MRSHFVMAEMTVWDGPRVGTRIAYGLVMASGGHIHARIGGLAQSPTSKGPRRAEVTALSC